jgi:hypothetical protein
MCCTSWHPGSQCVDEEQRLLIMSRRRARGGAGAKDTKAEMDLVQQLASLKFLRESSKGCPGCKMATEKTEGCNKMTCAYCNCFWCWKCEVEIGGYDHFKEGGCRCDPFGHDLKPPLSPTTATAPPKPPPPPSKKHQNPSGCSSRPRSTGGTPCLPPSAPRQ